MSMTPQRRAFAEKRLIKLRREQENVLKLLNAARTSEVVVSSDETIELLVKKKNSNHNTIKRWEKELAQ